MKKQVAIKKTANSQAPMQWSVGEFGAFYTEYRSELHAHAKRVLKDSAKAEEITQDALIKFLLAAPELESADHALSYLHRTIENLCIDLFRLEGRRPNLVLLDDATAEVEALWQVNSDHADVMSAAEDAAIIRQALAMLSPAERAALVMWEMEGRSTEEIAAELGIKESAVRHTVSRARASLRKVLSELIIDEERGLTALDMLSTTYKKASALAKKSSKVALSLLLVATAFLGFNSMTGNEGVIAPTSQTEISSGTTGTDSATATDTDASQSPTPSSATPSRSAKTNSDGLNIKTTGLTFAGLDKDGIPTGFTITDSNNVGGTTRMTKIAPVLTDEGAFLANQVLTATVGPNLILDQKVIVDGAGTRYEVTGVTFGQSGLWTLASVASSTFETERLSNGLYLMTVTISLGSIPTSSFTIPVGNRGYDLSAAPKSVTTRLLLNAGKTQILAQAIYVQTKK